MERKDIVLNWLKEHNIDYRIYEHPPLPTIEMAQEYWKDIDAQHCKNLFFRNHKGNRHYLVVFDWNKQLPIHTLEKALKQGKLSFASEERMDKWLGLKPGSVSPFGLINDTENHVYLFLDRDLQKAKHITFHPNDNRYTVELTQEGFQKYLSLIGNSYSFIDLDIPDTSGVEK